MKPRVITAAAIAVFVVAVVAVVVLANGSDDGGSDDGSNGGTGPTAAKAPPHAAKAPKHSAPRAVLAKAPGKSPPRGSGSVEKAIWGPVRMPDGKSAFPIYKRLGVDVLQLPLRWARVARERPANPVDPSDPSYEWPPEIEEAIEEGRRYGIEIAILATTTPGWANGGRSPIYVPRNPSDFGVFLTAAANRYPGVRHWIVWGEPNRGDRFQPNRAASPVGPRAYAVLLDVAYRALKNVSKDNVVIGGNLYSGGEVRPPEFLDWMRLADGRVPRLDWFGLDPYPFRIPNLSAEPVPGGYRDLSDLDTFGIEVDETYSGLGLKPPLWLSQFTVQSDQDSRYFEFHVGEAEQALWLRRGYEAAEEAGDVKGLGWYTLLDQPEGKWSADWGLMSAGGEPKPAFHAYVIAAGSPPAPRACGASSGRGSAGRCPARGR